MVTALLLGPDGAVWELGQQGWSRDHRGRLGFGRSDHSGLGHWGFGGLILSGEEVIKVFLKIVLPRGLLLRFLFLFLDVEGVF